jgi:nicotinate dehydrogenase subunit B
MRGAMKIEKSKSIENSKSEDFGRRDFMKLVGGGIVVCFSVDPSASAQGFGQGPPRQGFGMMGTGGATDFNAYLRIGDDGKITVFSGKIEQGQSNTTALAQMAAEELCVPLESITMVMGDTDLCPWDMGTFGSMSIRVYGPALRSAAAEAKAILIEMAAEQLKTPKEQLSSENGVIFVTADKKTRTTYAQLAKGQKISRKLVQKPQTKTASQFTIIGKSPVRVDAKDKVTGKAKFTGDLRFPDLLYAKLVRPPAHGATLKNVDASAAEKIPGVTIINQDGIIAALSADPETSEKALAAIKAEFDDPKGDVDNVTIFDRLLKTAPAPQPSEKKGDLAEGQKASTAIFEQTYFNGYGAHAPIETHTACAKLEGEKMTVWISTQAPFMNQGEIARAIGLASQNVRVITPFVGGGFGGKSYALQAVEAARLAKITGKPVQVSYSRAEEFFYDYYRPAAIVKIKSGVDSGGRICLWDYHVYCAGNRSAERFYDIPNHLITAYGGPMGGGAKVHPFNTGTWRAPGANINVFARESHIDIMAAKLKIDPLEFRLKNTSDPRMRSVLQAAAERFGYKNAVGPSGRGIGIGCGIDAETYVAEIAEIQVTNGKVKVKRIVAAQDMGIAVNPEGAKMQMEGCIMMGLGYALTEELNYQGGKILTANFGDYEMPRFSWLPEIEAVLVKNNELTEKGEATGGGEPAIVPVGAAIANAIFDATGARVFQMPLTPERINKAVKEKA